MGRKFSVEGFLEVLPAEPFPATLNPAGYTLPENDARPSVAYTIRFDRLGANFQGDVYLYIHGVAGDRYHLPATIPAGQDEAIFTIDLEDYPVGTTMFVIEGYEDPADLPPSA